MYLLSTLRRSRALVLLSSAFVLALIAMIPLTYARSDIAPLVPATPGRQAPGVVAQAQRYQSVTTDAIGELDSIDSTIGVTGTLAFVASRAGYQQESLGVMDISNPVRLSRHRLLPLDVLKLQLMGHYAYVGTVALGLQILDISDPLSPTVASSLTSFDGANRVSDLQVVGNRLYLLSTKQGQQSGSNVSTLWILDITQPRAPSIIASLPLLADSRVLRVSNTRVYVDALYIPRTGSGPGFGIIDVSNPTAPSALAAYTTPYPSFETVGTLVYRATGTALEILDTTLVDAPVVRSSTPISPTAATIHLRGDRAYVMGSIPDTLAAALTILDVSDTTNPVVLSTTEVPHQGCQPYVAGSLLFLQCDNGNTRLPGFQVYDVSNSLQPLLVGDYRVPKNVRRVQVSGDRAYLLEQPPPSTSLPTSDPCPWGGGTLWIVNIADPAVPLPISTFDLGGSCVELLATIGQRIYFADKNTIKIVNISDDTNATLETTVVLPVQGTVAQLVGSRAYVVADTRFFMVDISTPASPTLLGSYNFANVTIQTLQAVGDLVYVMAGSGLHSVDVSDPARPILLNVDAPLTVSGGPIEVVGQRAFLPGLSGGALSGSNITLKTVDISRPEAPALLASYTTDRVWSFVNSSPSRVRVANDLAFLISGSPNPASWLILDVTDDTQIRVVGRYTSVGKPHDAQVVGNRLYLVNAGGFQILEFVAPMCNCSEVYLPVVIRT